MHSLLLLILLSVSLAKSYKPVWIDTAISYLHVVEVGNNRGFNDKYFQSQLTKLGWKPSYSWCAFSAGYFKNATIDTNKGFWNYISGLAQNYFKKAPKTSIHTSKEVLNGKYVPVCGDMIIWGKGTTIQGHIGYVIEWFGRSGYTIEGNSINNGREGVNIMFRTIDLFKYQKIIGFVHIEN